MTIDQRLAELEQRYLELEQAIADTELIKRREEWQRLVKEHADLAEMVDLVA